MPPKFAHFNQERVDDYANRGVCDTLASHTNAAGGGHSLQNYQNLFVAKLPEHIRQDDLHVIMNEGLRRANEKRMGDVMATATSSASASGVSDFRSQADAAKVLLPPQSTMVSLNPETGVSKGFGFALFATNADGLAAHKALNNASVLYDHVKKQVVSFTFAGEQAEEGAVVVPKHQKKGKAKPQGVVVDGRTLYPFRLAITGSRFDGVMAAAASPCLYVRNIPLTLSQHEVSELLGHFGTVVFCAVRHDHLQRPIWVVFVEYDSVESAQRALTALHGNRALFPDAPAPVLAKFADTQEQREQRKSMRLGGVLTAPSSTMPQYQQQTLGARQHADPHNPPSMPSTAPSSGPFGLPQQTQPPPLVCAQPQQLQTVTHRAPPFTAGSSKTLSFVPYTTRTKPPLVTLVVPAAELGEDEDDRARLTAINESISSLPEVSGEKRRAEQETLTLVPVSGNGGVFPPAPPQAAISPSNRVRTQQLQRPHSPSNSATTPSGGNTHFRFNPYAADVPYVALEVVSVGDGATTGSRNDSLACTPTAVYKRSQQLITPTTGGRPAIVFHHHQSITQTNQSNAAAVSLDPYSNVSLSASRNPASSASASFPSGKRPSHSISSDSHTIRDSSNYVNIEVPQNWKGLATPVAANSSLDAHSSHLIKSSMSLDGRGQLKTTMHKEPENAQDNAPNADSIKSKQGGLGSGALYSPMANTGAKIVETMGPFPHPTQPQEVQIEIATNNDLAKALMMGQPIISSAIESTMGQQQSNRSEESTSVQRHNGNTHSTTRKPKPNDNRHQQRPKPNASAPAYYPPPPPPPMPMQYRGWQSAPPFHPQQFMGNYPINSVPNPTHQAGATAAQSNTGANSNPIPATQGGVLRPMWSKGIDWETTVTKGHQK